MNFKIQSGRHAKLGRRKVRFDRCNTIETQIGGGTT